MTITFKSNVDFKKIAAEQSEKRARLLSRALEEESRAIIERTRSGTGISGGKFEKLSEKYKKYKTKKGRRGVPDLTFSGRMLAAITSKVERTATGLLGSVFFNSPREADKARGNQKLRKFFGFSKEQIRRITEKLRK